MNNDATNEDDPILAYLADHECSEAEFYQRLRDALADLPDPPFSLRVQFAVEDAWTRLRRFFTA